MIGSITQLMIAQHAMINKKLQKLENTPEKQIKKIEKFFLDFKWNLQKHIFNEETNIFTIINHKDKLEVAQVKKLLEEHQEITVAIEEMADQIEQKKKPKIEKLSEKLSVHEQREVQILYPKLDARLSIEQKREVLNYSNEIKIV
jgi:iron-sulfur cluster repair protein YtfE (RIC family)